MYKNTPHLPESQFLPPATNQPNGQFAGIAEPEPPRQHGANQRGAVQVLSRDPSIHRGLALLRGLVALFGGLITLLRGLVALLAGLVAFVSGVVALLARLVALLG